MIGFYTKLLNRPLRRVPSSTRTITLPYFFISRQALFRQLALYFIDPKRNSLLFYINAIACVPSCVRSIILEVIELKNVGKSIEIRKIILFWSGFWFEE